MPGILPGHRRDPALEGRDGIVARAIAVDHQRVVERAPGRRGDGADEAARRDVLLDERQATRASRPRPSDRGAELQEHVVVLDVANRPQVGMPAFFNQCDQAVRVLAECSSVCGAAGPPRPGSDAGAAARGCRRAIARRPSTDARPGRCRPRCRNARRCRRRRRRSATCAMSWTGGRRCRVARVEVPPAAATASTRRSSPGRSRARRPPRAARSGRGAAGPRRWPGARRHWRRH